MKELKEVINEKLREEIAKKIAYFRNVKGINEEQFKVISTILNKAESLDELDASAKILDQRVGFGFEFDEAPHLKNGTSIPILEKDEDKYQIQGGAKPLFGKTPPNHVLIIGENLQVLQNLLICYRNRIDIIYIDPPYNTGDSNLDYKDKFSKDSWLNMMKQRMEIAYELLSDDGVIFVSLDDNMQAYFKVMMDEIFGEEYFIDNLVWIRNPGGKSDSKNFAKTKEYILVYSKNKDLTLKPLEKDIPVKGTYLDLKNQWYWRKGNSITKGGSNSLLTDRKNLGYAIYYNPKTNDIKIDDSYDKDLIQEYIDKHENIPLSEPIYKINQDLINNGYVFYKPKENANTFGRWRMGSAYFLELFNQDRLIFENNNIYEKEIFEIDKNFKPIKPKDFIDWISNQNATIKLKEIGVKFSNPKPYQLIEYLINLIDKKDAIILDFFAGSGTTGQAVLDLNRKDNGTRQFILCTREKDGDNDENNIGYDVCWERLYRINTGKTSKNESIPWIDDNEPFLNAVDVYKISKNGLDVSLKNNPHDEYLDYLEKNHIFDIYNRLNPSLKLNKDNAYSLMYSLLDHIGE